MTEHLEALAVALHNSKHLTIQTSVESQLPCVGPCTEKILKYTLKQIDKSTLKVF